MNWLPPGLLVVPVVSLLALGLFPTRRPNPTRSGGVGATPGRSSSSRRAHPGNPDSDYGAFPGHSADRNQVACSTGRDAAALRMGQLTIIFTSLSLLISLVAAVQVISTGPIDASFIQWTDPVPFCLGVHVDAITVVMMMLISFIGLVIARFSMTYLLGDPGQARFFRWMSVTLGATLLLVISCNLVMLTGAWMLTSFGLHQLLLYYPERSWAVWAARKKFLISRVGDFMLIAALILTYRCFGTTEYSEIFAAAETIHHGSAEASLSTSLIGILFVLGAMTKSAQFPFHSWLPDTMETPTPVSALMHAGVINAGGFLVIRLSPLVTLSPIALNLLAITGALTALLGSVVMLTQTSIKRSLAYSTIAQMGFMMLQCGLGAFSAALLHIVAHSAYKAHAFLSCGSVLDNAARHNIPPVPRASVEGSVAAFLGAITMATGIGLGTFYLMGIDLSTKPGGAVLGLVLILALTQLLWNGLATGFLALSVRSIACALLVTVTYSASYRAIDHLVKGSTTLHQVSSSLLDVIVLTIVAVGFVLVFSLQTLSGPLAKRRWIKALYVHAMNGFYVDIPARQLTARIYGQKAAVQ